MDPARWKRVDSLLKSAISLPPQKRDAYLASECGDDEELERELRDLLGSHQEAGEFLETPVMERAASSLAQDTATLNGKTSSGQALPGATFSHYQVVEQLGCGRNGSRVEGSGHAAEPICGAEVFALQPW